MTNMKLKSIYKLTGKIVVETGLHIGAGNDVIEIGGLDNPVLRDRAGHPYIPGSSLKGKMRSLLEWSTGKVVVNEEKGTSEPHSCQEGVCLICRLFGSPSNDNVNLGPPRLLVRDAMLSKEWRNSDSLTEAKYENTIDRVTGKAGHPRQLERVHAGVAFDFELIYRHFNQSDDDVLKDKNAILDSLQLLENDYLGGCGSRGSGKVFFDIPPVKGDEIWEDVPIERVK